MTNFRQQGMSTLRQRMLYLQNNYQKKTCALLLFGHEAKRCIEQHVILVDQCNCMETFIQFPPVLAILDNV